MVAPLSLDASLGHLLPSFFVHSLLFHDTHTHSRHLSRKHLITLLITIAYALINRIRRSRTPDVNSMQCALHYTATAEEKNEKC